MISKVSSMSGFKMTNKSSGLDVDEIARIKEKDEQKILDDQRKSMGKEYKGDESRLLQLIAEKSGKFEFKEFLSIREGLKGADKTLFTLAALNVKDRISDLNAVVKDYLNGYETTGFLRAGYMAGEEEAGMLLDLAKRYRSPGKKGTDLTLVVSAASNLNLTDMNNFIRAVHNGKASVREIYEIAFGMEEKGGSLFLSSAANAKTGMSDLVKWTKRLGKDFIKKDTLEDNMVFIGLMNDGQPVSARFANGGFKEFSSKLTLRERNMPDNDLNSDTEEAKTFEDFLDKASKSKDGVDSFLKLVERFGFDQESRAFKFIDGLEDENLPHFVKAAASADDYGLEKMMDISGGLKGSDRKNFLAAAASADKNLSRFMAMADRLHGDLLAKFLSNAAKSGESIGSFLDAAQQLKDEELSEMLDLMEEMDQEETDNLFHASKTADIPLKDLINLLEKLDLENRKYLLAMSKMKEMDFKTLFDRYKDMDVERLNLLLDTEREKRNSPFYAMI